MTMKAIDIGLIQARRTKLITDIESHRSAIADLEAKLAELEIAERVFAELSLESGNGSEPLYANESARELADVLDAISPASSTHRSGSKGKKPEGLPSIPDMILEAIRYAQNLGAPGLDPTGMNSYIRGRFWPNAPANVIGPTAWRMWKRNELVKTGSVYSLPKTTESRDIGLDHTTYQPNPSKTSDLLSGTGTVALTPNELTH